MHQSSSSSQVKKGTKVSNQSTKKQPKPKEEGKEGTQSESRKLEEDPN
jgi:hypothetical protein